jgi:hypothetical protein
MCFSASASLGAGVVLSVIGVASIRKAKEPSQLFFAGIPLIFAVQQISEGFVWLSLSHQAFASWQRAVTYIFLFFAQVVWPVWVPLAILKMGPKAGWTPAGIFLTGTGALVSLYLAFCLLAFHTEAKIIGYHISYEQDFPAAIGRYCGGLYIIATVFSPFFSRTRHMWMLGTTILISYIITRIFYHDYIVSVWCFFASIISIAVLIILYSMKDPKKMKSNPGFGN